jgi:hypothetical protein
MTEAERDFETMCFFKNYTKKVVSVVESGSEIYAVVGTDEYSSELSGSLKFEDLLDLLRKC